MDFQTAVLESVNKLAGSGHIEKQIEAAVSKTIAEIINDELKSYSEFGKNVKEAVKKSLSFQSAQINLPEYNAMILKVVARQVDAALGAVVEKQVSENLKDILSPMPEQLTVQDLVDKLIEKVKDDGGCHCDRRGILIELDGGTGDGVCGGYWHLYLHDEPEIKGSYGSNKYTYKYQIAVTDKGEVYSVSFGGQDIDKRMFLGPYYGFERYLLALKTCRTRLVKPDSVDDINTYVEQYAD